MAGHAYEHLGATYVRFRRPDPRIEQQLAGDLASGEWHRRHAHELQEPDIDAGYRIVVGTPSG